MADRRGNAWTGRQTIEQYVYFDHKILFNICWGLFNIYARVCGIMSSCIVLKTEGGLLMESEIYAAKVSLSDLEVSMNICNIMQAIIYSIFLPLFLYCFLHIVISIFSSAQAWGIMADDSWTRHQWQRITPCLLAKCYWLKSLALPQFTAAKCLVLLGFAWEMTFIFLIRILTLCSLHVCAKVTSPARVDRFRDAQNGTGKWGEFYFLSSLFVFEKKASKNGL